MDTKTHLLQMAKQIADNFSGYGPEVATEKVTKHLKSFWEPRMKAALFAHLDEGGADLPPVVKEAATRLRAMY
jgi:formate dehydrogenase subunit delta